jgi:isopenicillin-N epimerase
MKSLWMLDPAVSFLNHGSFGARLRSVVEAQEEWRRRFEARPVEFLDREAIALHDDAKRAVGTFLGMSPERFGFITNATDGVNAVLRSIRIEPGDELVTINHAYPAVRCAMRFFAERAGARYIEAIVPTPVRAPESIVESIASILSDRTHLVIVDEITSPTALRLPVQRILELCDDRGIDVLIDGAHAPGMLEVDVESLNPAYYTGNLHKWIGAPPGAAFLWVRDDRIGEIHPTVISLKLGEGFVEEFRWQGTRDISPWLAAVDAINAMDELLGEESWPRIRAHNHAMATWAQHLLARAWEVEPISPRDGSMLGSMCAVPLPERARRFESKEALQARIRDEHRIEAPVTECGDRWFIRASCQVYNTADEYERLAGAVRAVLG